MCGMAPLVADYRVGAALSGGMIAQCHVDHKTGFWKKRFSEERFSKNRCCLYTVCKYSAYTSMAQAASGLHHPIFCIHVACIRDMCSSRAEGDRPVRLVQRQFEDRRGPGVDDRWYHRFGPTIRR